MRLPLIGGSYRARSIIAAAQRCVNLFPELNPKDQSDIPITHYQRPGLRRLSSPPTPAHGRSIYRASNGQAYASIGAGIFSIDTSTWALTHLGDVTVGRTTPVSFSDNGVTVVLVDGSESGWAIDLTTNVMVPIVDSTGTFQGGIRADIIDTFLIFGPSPPNSGSNRWVSTLSNQVQFDGLSVGGKTDFPDPMQSLFVNRHEILLIGELKSEIWYDAGNAQFPFAELPGAYIEHGTCAPYSLASSDISVFWLGQDLQGDGVVFRQRGYVTTRISTHAIEYAMRQIKKNGGTLTDAVGYTYQQDGHYFYILNFSSGDQTWVFDDAMVDPLIAWSQRGWTDQAGNLHRERVNGAANIAGIIVGLDWETGDLLELDLDYFADDVSGTATNISYIRTFPHIGTGKDAGTGQIISADGKLVQFNSFILDAECGTSSADNTVRPAPTFTLKYSDDRGRTFSGVGILQRGTNGEFVWPTARGLGQARDRIFEISWSGDGQCALNGAWIEGKVSNN